MTTATRVVLLDVNETLSDLSVLRDRFTQVGAPPHLLDTWFAATLRDGFALAATGSAQPFKAIGAAVLRTLLPQHPLSVPLEEAVETVLSGFTALPVHPDVPPGLRAMVDGGLRLATLTNGAAPLTALLLERAELTDLVERTLSVDDAGRWKPDRRPYLWAAEQMGVPPQECAMVAVHPWDLHGAAAAGLRTAYVDRSGTPYPDVFTAPDVVGADFPEVAAGLLGRG